MIAIICVLLTAAVLLFPIFLNIIIFFDAGQKKCYFALYLLRFIKIYGGYAELYKKRGIAIHLSEKKAVLLPFSEIINSGKKFEVTKGFILYGFSHVFEFGSAENPGRSLMICALMRTATCFGAAYLKRKNSCASFKGDILLYQNTDCCKICVRLILLFNPALLLSAAVKLVLKKITEGQNGKISPKGQ